jgi:PKD repeat protein
VGPFGLLDRKVGQCQFWSRFPRAVGQKWSTSLCWYVVATDNHGASSTSSIWDFWTLGPQADFTAFPTFGEAPLSVQFTNQSTGSYSTCIWDFGDGNTSDSCADQLHVYSQSGIYTVTMTISWLGGSDFMTRADYISVTEKEDFYLYLPVILNAPTRSSGEPNDLCATAFSINTDATYQFLAEDRVDWYQFDLTADSHLTVQLTEFVPLAGQIALYRGDNCTSRVYLGNDGRIGTSKQIDAGIQPAGHYYIFVGNDGVLNTVDQYKLHVIGNDSSSYYFDDFNDPGSSWVIRRTNSTSSVVEYSTRYNQKLWIGEEKEVAYPRR